MRFCYICFLINHLMKQNDTKEDKNYYTKFDEHLNNFFLTIFNKIGIAGTVFALLLLLILFIWLVSLEPFLLTFDIASSSSVGDALGGITSPVIGLIAIILTYKAFKVQYDFNVKQLDFNNKQITFIKNDKIDRKVEEYNKLLELIIINKSELFSKVKLLEVTISRKAFDLIKKKYKNKNLQYNSLEHLLTSNLLECFKNELGLHEAYKIENLESEVHKFMRIVLRETVSLRNLLLTFLKEVENMEIDKDEKIKLLGFFCDKFMLLNDKTNTFIIYLSFHKFLFTDSLRNSLLTKDDKEILENSMNNLLKLNKEENIEFLSYLSLNYK